MCSCAWQNTACTGAPSTSRALVDELDEVLADLEADVVALRLDRRALEQELRVGAADLDLELARGASSGFAPRNFWKNTSSGLTCWRIRTLTSAHRGRA